MVFLGLRFLPPGDVGVDGGAALVGDELLPAADDAELLLESPDLERDLPGQLGVDESWTEFRNWFSSIMLLAAMMARLRSAFTSSLSVLGELRSLTLVPCRKGSHSALRLLFSAMYLQLSMLPSALTSHTFL